MPTRPGTYCDYGDWHLRYRNVVTGTRGFGTFIYDQCDGNKQLFPVAADPSYGSCNNDDNALPSARFSLCPVLGRGVVPAGSAFDAGCLALAEASVALNATVAPTAYDAALPTPLVATTSFNPDFQQRLSDATCSDVLDWVVTAWEFRWKDGTTDPQPGSGKSGAIDPHTTVPGQGGVQAASVVALAHIHITAQAIDLDPNGNPVVVQLARDVIISNDASADSAGGGAAALPVYTPPKLLLGAISAPQNPDGSLTPLDASAPATAHTNTLRGRLLQLYPRAIVVQPGTESIGGVVVGQGQTTTVAWAYLGSATDAPARLATLPGDTGQAGDPVDVQWNHASRLDAQGQPVDEAVPLRITARTVYPDGHVETGQLGGQVAVSIYYVGLNDPGG